MTILTETDTYTTLREAGGEVALGGGEGSSRGAEEDGRGLHLVGLGFVCCLSAGRICKKSEF